MNAAFRWAVPLLALIAASLSGARAQTDDAVSYDLATSRLRACITAGAEGAPRDSLQSAVVAVRSLCGAQIARVRDRRVADATRGLTGEEAKAAETRAILALNDEIARTIASLTGLTP
jgi:hypothetical protein